MVGFWEIDFDAGRVRLELADGTVFEDAMSSPIPVGSAVRRSRFDTQERRLELTLDDGQKLEVEIGTPGQAIPDDVPVVYLDQNHWVGLAQHLWAPERLREAERDAAAVLIAFARERRVVLPIAAAHLTEAAPLAGRRRRDLSATILGLSRGWQMRSPIWVRFTEYVASMRGQDPIAAEVFTLEPGVLFANGPTRPTAPPGTPVALEAVFARVVAAAAVYASILDDEPLDVSEAREAAERWAAGFSGLATWMRENRTPERDARTNARARLIADQGPELARAASSAGTSPERFSMWLEHDFPNDLARMPYVGRLAEVLYLRLRNADEKWEGNDLNDMNYLCCAAGYADVTVGERKTIEYLRRAERRVRPGSLLCRNLAEAAEALANRGVIP